MVRSFMVPVPERAFHGSFSIKALAQGMPAASGCGLFTRVAWSRHDSWMSGGPHLEEGIPYANIVWEALGLRDRRSCPEVIPEWAKGIRSFDDLAGEVGILFFTDRVEDASRYGEVSEIDLADEAVLDVIVDPHVRTHAGWIALIRTGAPVPFLAPPAPKP